MAEQRVRRTELDALRILAAWMVVLIHVCAFCIGSEGFPGQSPGWVYLLDSLVRSSAVPLFVMVSGSLFLGGREMIPLQRILKKYMLRLFLLYLFWALFYAVDACGPAAFLSAAGWKQLILTALEGKYHLWYLPRLIGTYALIPLFSALIRYRRGRYVPYVLLMCFLFIALKNLALAVNAPEQVRGFIEKFEFPLNSFAPFFLLGWFLSDRRLPRIGTARLAVFWGIVVAVKTAADHFLGLRGVLSEEALMQINSVPAFLEAGALFLIFQNLAGCGFFARHGAKLALLSDCTLGTYLLHVFILEHAGGPFFRLERWLPTPVCLLLFTTLVFALATVLSWLLRKVPWLKGRIV